MHNKKLLRSHEDERDDMQYVQGRESAAAAAANVDSPRAHSTNARCNGPLWYLPADRKATELVFVVTAAAAAARKVSAAARRGEACGAGSDSRVMGGSAHSNCQSQPSYPLNG